MWVKLRPEEFGGASDACWRSSYPACFATNGVRTVIVEDASRFARTLMAQEAGIATLAGLRVRVIKSRGDDLTESDDEMRVAMRQIVGVFSQLEKTRLVKKLRAARERKRQSATRAGPAANHMLRSILRPSPWPSA